MRRVVVAFRATHRLPSHRKSSSVSSNQSLFFASRASGLLSQASRRATLHTAFILFPRALYASRPFAAMAARTDRRSAASQLDSEPLAASRSPGPSAFAGGIAHIAVHRCTNKWAGSLDRCPSDNTNPTASPNDGPVQRPPCFGYAIRVLCSPGLTFLAASVTIWATSWR